MSSRQEPEQHPQDLQTVTYVAMPRTGSVLLDPDQDVQTLYPPLLLAQQPLDPLIHCARTCFPSYSVDRALDGLLRCVCSCLRDHASSLQQRCCFIQRQPGCVGERRVEPWRMEIEQRDDKDEEE